MLGYLLTFTGIPVLNWTSSSCQVGDRVGMMLKSGGLLHFYINGRDQGMAAVCPNGPYWGVVDLYGLSLIHI